MSKQKPASPRRARDRNELREDALGPNPFLGYDRESLAAHLMSVGAYEIAETQLRRAVVVNPFEARFKRRLAWCLYMRKQYAEACEWIEQALERDPNNRDSLDIRHEIAEALSASRPGLHPQEAQHGQAQQ